MNLNPQRREWFFPIEEAPVLVAITHKGVARDVRVPRKKALIAADTGDILGIVGTGYKVFTNEQAVTLCHKFCLEAFPDTTPAEWTFVEGHGPGTRSWAAMDILHRTHAMNLWGNEGGASETFTPFVRITNSYNGSRALRIDVGYQEFTLPDRRIPPSGVSIRPLCGSKDETPLERVVRFDSVGVEHGQPPRIVATHAHLEVVEIHGDEFAFG